MQHLLNVDFLSKKDIYNIFSLAEKYLSNCNNDLLKGQKVINLFFENSTRTRSSFEIAAKNMHAKVINIDISKSSVQKGESEIDTILTLNAMSPSFITLRHSQSGYAEFLASYSNNAAIINSGDGAHAHPTQALLDAFTIYLHKKDFSNLKIAICGDILNSRVARSNILLLTSLGAKIRLTAPSTLLPYHLKNDNISLHNNLNEGIKDVDIIISLRIQHERMKGCFIPSTKEYFKYFGITKERLKYAKKDVLVLHPGPMNRNVEISDEIANDSKKCLVLEQVANGIAIRQAILEFLYLKNSK